MAAEIDRLRRIAGLLEDMGAGAFSAHIMCAVKEIEGLRKDRLPHMCRDGHPEIRHADPGDDERCPVCRERDRAEEAEAARDEAVQLATQGRLAHGVAARQRDEAQAEVARLQSLLPGTESYAHRRRRLRRALYGIEAPNNPPSGGSSGSRR